MRIRLDREDLFKVARSDVTALERLASFLRARVSRSGPDYRGRLVNAIMRAEKEIARRPRRPVP